MKIVYDYLIVGSGLFGAIFANEASKRNKSCLILEKRSNIGGNVYTQQKDGINIHAYGAHIFHTSNETVWNYVNQFARFNNYVNSPVANYHGELYNLPFNMNTFYQMWRVITPDQARQTIEKQKKPLLGEPANLEEQAQSLIGNDIYQKLIKGYTEKQWGRDCTQLPASIIRRLPVRYTYDNNYFNDPYQGIPMGGYTKMIEQMLDGCDVKLNTDFNTDREGFSKLAHKIIYTGQLDAYFDYCYGPLEYRSLRFETEKLDIENYQGVAVMNYTDSETPYTRIIEHKHFEFGKQPNTYITREYPLEWSLGIEPYYPINDEKNQELFQRYHLLAEEQNKTIFGGRLPEYRYYDMDKTVELALEVVRQELGEGVNYGH
ncbi:MAG: UDP-galactopyranose mutase [Oscillospiraceae bacterium]|nr:UDP-galactopyranose mutase [Oscillospiraceae bacterium]